MTGPQTAVKVTRTPEYPDDTELGSATRRGADYLILVNDVRIGSTWWCDASYIRRGQKWASYGPAGLSKGHRTREDAEQAQVDAYLAGHAATGPAAASVPAARGIGPVDERDRDP